MGSRATASRNVMLTNYAVGLAPEIKGGILTDWLAPEAPVAAAIGQYKSYNTQQPFQIYKTRRAVGGPATRVQFSADDASFNCLPNALEATIDIAERDTEGDNGSNLEQAKTRLLITNAKLARENEVCTAALAALSAVSGSGVWSDPDVDPIDEIDAQIEAICTAAGMFPNALAIGVGAWRVLKNHPKVRARMPGASKVNPSLNDFCSMLLNPAIEGRVGILSKDTKKIGGTKTTTNILGAEMIIFLRNENPDQYDPSFMKTFTTKKGSVDAVYMYQEGPRLDVISVDWSEDIVATSAASARRITIS